ncbi:protein of unknown function [Burkholderia sp. D7]|nr:protein of unknown function [Burkholderia sp. D7]
MTDPIKAHCPRCDGERNCEIHGYFKVVWRDEQSTVSGRDDHQLSQCKGCSTVFYQLTSSNSENVDYWQDPTAGEIHQDTSYEITTYPAPDRKDAKPDWVWSLAKIDPPLHEILTETYTARDGGSYFLASVGLRTAFDRATTILKIDPGETLEGKIKKLHEGGFIGETEAMTLGTVADAGNAAAPRGWSPTAEHFETLLSTLEHFIYRTVMNDKKALAMKDAIPPRHLRPKRAKNAEA